MLLFFLAILLVLVEKSFNLLFIDSLHWLSGEDVIRHDTLRTGWALVGAQLAREHEEAVVAHQVAAGDQLDQLH